MHQTGTQHQHDLPDHELVILASLLGLEHYVVEPWRRVAELIGHQLHQQHAFEEVERLGHPHTGIGQAKQRGHLGVLPGILGFLAAKF
ncbi:hypothetical protein D3C85_1804820 [compost metagenome]